MCVPYLLFNSACLLILLQLSYLSISVSHLFIAQHMFSVLRQQEREAANKQMDISRVMALKQELARVFCFFLQFSQLLFGC